jgi:glutamate synthase (NADPH/NADH) large chain
MAPGPQLRGRHAVLNPDPILAQATRDIIDEELERETLSLVGWRKVPIDTNVLGSIAKASCPALNRSLSTPPRLGRQGSRAASISCAAAQKHRGDLLYVVSLPTWSPSTKGLCMPVDLPRFYLDLADIRMQAPSACSTSVSPPTPAALAAGATVPLPRPQRRDQHHCRQPPVGQGAQLQVRHPLIPDLQEAAPFVNTTGSDSSSLDNMLDLFPAGGMDLFRAMRADPACVAEAPEHG